MTLEVAVVAADRQVWSGEADGVVARTTDGDFGVLTGHAPLLGVLGPGVVQVRRSGEDGATPLLVAITGGFVSVADNHVSILAEQAELADDIDASAAADDLRRAEQGDDAGAVAIARARVAVASGTPH